MNEPVFFKFISLFEYLVVAGDTETMKAIQDFTIQALPLPVEVKVPAGSTAAESPFVGSAAEQQAAKNKVATGSAIPADALFDNQTEATAKETENNQ